MKNKIGKYNYFLPEGNAIEYKKILEYRVIFEYKNNKLLLPEIYCFNDIDSTKKFVDTLDNIKYATINVVIYHDGMYLEDDKGKYYEKYTNKRYSYKKIKIITEVPLGDIDKEYRISLY